MVQRDFTERTLKVLLQYDDYLKKQHEKTKEVEELEVTLLVNCLNGLIVVPYEYANRDNAPSSVEVCKGDTNAIKDLGKEWGLNEVVIERICDFDQKTSIEPTTNANLRLFVYRMRNSMAHSRFQDGTKGIEKGIGIIYQATSFDPGRSRIEKLIFQDKENRFATVIPVGGLRKFAEKFAKEALTLFEK